MNVPKVLIVLGLAGAAYAHFSQPQSVEVASSADQREGVPAGGEPLGTADKDLLKKMGLPTEGAVVIGRETIVGSRDEAAGSSNAPFVPMPTPVGQPVSGVIVFAPANCPQAAGQRADDLMKRLNAAGIPAIRASEANFNAEGMTPEAVMNMNRVMMGSLPAVFVNGTGKANPSFDEVAAQYKRTRG